MSKTIPSSVRPQGAPATLFKVRKSVLTFSGLLLSIASAGDIAAQEDAAGSTPETLEEVVVTGTLIRGSNPTGTNVIDMDNQQVEATGAISATQLLQTLPQNESFNSVQRPTGSSIFVTTNRPSLRDIPGNNSGGSTTLVLFDGRRIVGMGAAATTADPDIVPPHLIERVEVVPDGGSAIYGSDAVAGVINFVTLKEFEGLEVEARYGTADSYDSFDGSITGGFSWGSGNTYISYNRSTNDSLNGDELGWYRMYPQDGSSLGLPAGETVLATVCSPGNVRIQGKPLIYGLPYGPTNEGANPPTPGSPNECDITQDIDLYPKVERDSIMVGFNQQLGEAVNLEVRGYYMNREVRANGGPSFSSQLVFFTDVPQFNIAGSPFFREHLTAPLDFSDPELHEVDMLYGPDRIQEIDLETFGIYPTLTVDLPNDWLLRAMLSYGESENEAVSPGADSSTQTRAISTGLLNPYDIPTSNPEAIAGITNFATYGLSEQSLLDVNLIVDGALFSLPGGEVKLAGGVAYSEQEYDATIGGIVSGSENTGFAYEGLTIDDPEFGVVELIPALTRSDQVATSALSRDVKSAFAEVMIPIFGPGNAVTGIQDLSVSLSARYDDYSDFGDTTNPKLGLTWQPVDWFTVRGSWGESFVAPSLANDETAQLSSANAVSGATLGFLLPPQELIDAGELPPVTGDSVIVVLGNAPDIEPQDATTTSIGFDVQPPFAENLMLSLTWWDIEFQKLIAIPGFTNQFTSWTTFRSFKTVYPSQAEIDALLASVDEVNISASTVEGNVYAITDARINNTGDFNTDGLDLQASYFLETGFGIVDFDLNATYVLNREQSGAPGQPFTDLLETDYSQFRTIATVGTDVGNLRAQASMRYSEGYDLGATVGSPPQHKVDSYTTVDLFFRYDVPGSGWLDNLSLTLNVNNVFDEDPPEYRTVNTLVVQENGYRNGGTIGRFVQFGFRKKFD